MESSLRHILHSSNPTTTLVDHTQTNGADTDTTVANARRKRPASRVKSSYPRKRAIRACRNCRVRRTKCDNALPACASCADLGAECIYSDGDPSTFDSASLAILERLNTLEELLRASTSTRVVTVDESDDPSASLLLLKNLGSPTLERSRESFSYHINIEAVLAWPVFEDQDFGQRLDLRALLQVNNDNALQPSIPYADFEHCDGEQLLQHFLDHVFIFNPILEESKVRKYMRDARFNGLGWDVQSCLLLLIYAHGSIAAPFDSTHTSDSTAFRQTAEFKQAESFFFAAQKRMGLLLCRSGVLEAQCFFLAGVYLMSTLRPIEAWKMFVQALACCQGFYSEKRAIHDLENETEQRLQESIYWTCFKSELELRLELNISEKSVWDLTYPAFFPSPPQGLKSQGETVWYFYLAEIALRRLGNRILNYIYKCQPSVSPNLIADSTSSFEHQADGWIRSLPTALNLDAETDENALHSTLKFILNGHLLDCYEMMYWPFVVEAISNASHARPAKSLSPIIESFARKGLLVCVQRIQKNEQGFYHRHHGTWLMLRSCTRSALVLVAAARARASLENLLPRGWEEAVYKVMGMLRFWRDESRDVEDRLGVLEGLMDGLTLGGGLNGAPGM